MAELESRVEKLEDKYHSIDKRQESFETFMRAYIDGNEKRIERFETRMDQLEAKIDSKFDSMMKFIQSLTITAMVGMLGIAGSVVYFVYSVTPKP